MSVPGKTKRRGLIGRLPRLFQARLCRYRGPGFIPFASIILLASKERRKSRKTFAVSVSFAPDTKKA
jgi:hypothetical protein